MRLEVAARTGNLTLTSQTGLVTNASTWEIGFILDLTRTFIVFLEVNKTSNENCNERDFMTNITRGGRDVFELTESRPYYFISGRGFCFRGMKVAVDVEDIPLPPPPAPSPGKSNSPSNSWSQSFLPLVATLLFLIFLSNY
ncbi:hypothetical protein REPUB_Repub05bG0191600 [Reevesia pubescens]